MPLTNPRGIVSLGNMKNETAATKASPKGPSVSTKPRDEMTSGEVWEEMGILNLKEEQKEQIKAFNKQGEKYLEIYKKHRDKYRAEAGERREIEVLLQYAAYAIMLEEQRHA